VIRKVFSVYVSLKDFFFREILDDFKSPILVSCIQSHLIVKVHSNKPWRNFTNENISMNHA